MTLTDIIGDFAAFYWQQLNRLRDLGVDATGYAVSHVAYRVASLDEYLAVRNQIEALCRANVENVWNGRPISKMLLSESAGLGNGASVDLVELIPPEHGAPVAMGLEHVGIVIGEDVDEFARTHEAAITKQQHQSENCEPYLITFHDLTTVKFYRYSLMDVCVREGWVFDDFHHVV